MQAEQTPITPLENKRLLLVLPTSTYRAEAFVQAALSLKIELVVGSNETSSLEALNRGKTMTINVDNSEQGLKDILRVHQNRPFDAILGVDDRSVLLAARASELLKLKSSPSDAVKRTRNKYLLRQALKGSLPTPTFSLYKENIQCSFPSVVKPLFLSGSRGVIRVNNVNELLTSTQRIRKILDDREVQAIAPGIEWQDKILIEEYIPGPEFVLEGLLEQGQLKVLAIFDKPDPLEGPFFEETLFVTPSNLSLDRQKRLVRTVETAINLIGLTQGSIHAEVRLKDEQFYLIDLAARSIGGLCSYALELYLGVSIEELMIQELLGGTAKIEPICPSAGVMMIPIPRAGKLIHVSGLETAQQIEFIDKIKISMHRGEEVIPLPEGNRYLGFIFARGPSYQQVEQALRDAFNRLEFEIK